MTTTPPQNSPKASNVAFIPTPKMPMKAKNDRAQTDIASFKSMAIEYRKGH